MQLTIFAKKRTTKEGKKFYTYITRLHKKDGTELVAGVKFKEECGQPKADNCPMNILCEKSDMNFSTKNLINEETGEEFESHTLWINNWAESPEKYVDTSMDEFI